MAHWEDQGHFDYRHGMIGVSWVTFSSVPSLSGFPEPANEVQHLVRVLPWEPKTSKSPLKNGVRLPDYEQRGDKEGERNSSRPN